MSLKFFDDDNRSTKKFVLDIEDIMYSLDQQDVYYKIKNKIVSVCGEYFEKSVADESWVKNNSLGLNVQSDVDGVDDVEKINETFLDVTITKAETTNVHTKWGTCKKNRSLNDTLMEIIINMQPTDLILNMDSLVSFLPILNVFHTDKGDPEESTGFASVSDLALIHFKSNGIRIFLPCTTADHKHNANVLIFKV